MTIIDLDTVKTNLGLSDTTYDAQISAQIPIIDAKVKQICNDNFNAQIVLDTTNGSAYAEVYAAYDWWGGKRREHYRQSPMLKQIVGDIPVGTRIVGEGIPDGTYVSDVYYTASVEFDGVTYSNPTIKLSAEATATNSAAQCFYGWNIAYNSVVSKGIWWLIKGASTTIEDDTWTSKSYGPVSVSRSAGSSGKIHNESGMPMWFVNALPRYH